MCIYLDVLLSRKANVLNLKSLQKQIFSCCVLFSWVKRYVPSVTLNLSTLSHAENSAQKADSECRPQLARGSWLLLSLNAWERFPDDVGTRQSQIDLLISASQWMDVEVLVVLCACLNAQNWCFGVSHNYLLHILRQNCRWKAEAPDLSTSRTGWLICATSREALCQHGMSSLLYPVTLLIQHCCVLNDNK